MPERVPWYLLPERCMSCGRFVRPEAPGVSWGQTWRQTWDGPELDDPRYRCSPCTDREGIPPTNCDPRYPGNGRNANTTPEGSP